MATDAEVLADVPFFALLDDGERAALAERLDTVAAPAGTVLFHLGDPGGRLFVVRSGIVELFFKNDTGEKIVLEVASAGDFFGEISLLDEGPRTATATAATGVDALMIDRDDLDELFRLRPTAALDVLAATGRRLRHAAVLLRNAATRNPNEDLEDRRSLVMKAADWIAAWTGSLQFLGLHILWFGAWLGWNTLAPEARRFDPFPFGFLTLVVSLEAIILSVFVLLSQNRQVERDRVRNDVEYDVNLKAEMQIAHLHEKFDENYAEMHKRLERIEQRLGTRGAASAATR